MKIEVNWSGDTEMKIEVHGSGYTEMKIEVNWNGETLKLRMKGIEVERYWKDDWSRDT